MGKNTFLKKILLFAGLLISLVSSAQYSPFAPGYTGINSRYDWLGGRFYALHVPVFNGSPSLRTGQWTGDGAIGFDTASGKLYIYWNSSMRELLKAADTTSKWVNAVFRRNDSVFVNIGGSVAFAYKDSVGGAGSGNPNSNVGSSFRWAIPNTNNIKTLALSNILKGDSATSNTITISTNQTPYTVSSSSNAITLNMNNGYVPVTTLTEDINTVTISNILDGTVFVWAIVQGAGPYNVTVPGAGLLSLPLTSGDTAIARCIKVGSVYFWSVEGGASSSVTLTGDVTGSGSGSISTTVANNAITFAKFQTLNANKLIGRGGTSGNAIEIGLGSGFSIDGSSNLQFSGGSGITIGTTAITSGTAQRILFESSGNVVSQAANFSFTPGSGAEFRVPSTSTVVNQVFQTSGDDVQFVVNDGVFTMKTGTALADAITVDHNQKLLVGTTGASGTAKLQLVGNSRFTGDHFQVSSGATTSFNAHNSDNTGGALLYATKDWQLQNNSVVRFTFQNNGTIGVNGSSSGTISLIPAAAAGTYNWRWPTTAGSSGEVLTSAGGGSPMTWTAIAATSRGTYTPTYTNTTNVDATTAFVTNYFVVGDMVTVSGKLEIDPTATGLVEIGVSLPVASAFGNEYECGGAGMCLSHAEGIGIVADVANARAVFKFRTARTENNTYSFTFTYKVTPP